MSLKETYKAYSTKNYKMFKRLDENRDVDHVNKVVKSIKKVGFVPVPIIVNEKNEIIDGQNRFEACQKLGLPVYYISVDGLNIDHCRSLNIGQSNWKMKDYIKSYAQHNPSYSYLLHLMRQFPQFTPRVIAVATGSFGVTGGGHTQSINEGRYTCSPADYNKAYVFLSYLKELLPTIQKIPGKNEYVHLGLLFAFKLTQVDDERLISSFIKNALFRDSISDGVVNIEGAIKGVDDVYNYHRGKKYQFDIVSEYRKAIRGVSA